MTIPKARLFDIENWEFEISEVKQSQTWLVLSWETAWEYQVLFFLFFSTAGL